MHNTCYRLTESIFKLAAFIPASEEDGVFCRATINTVMTKMIHHVLGLPEMKDHLIDDEDESVELSDEENQAALDSTLALAGQAETVLDIQSGDGHAQAMDQIHKDTLKNARDLVDLGFNVDHRSAATIFEKSAMMYKIALDAKDSKRKYQLEARKLLQSERKLALEEIRLKHEMGEQTVETESTVVVDRNDLIKKFREQKAIAKLAEAGQ